MSLQVTYVNGFAALSTGEFRMVENRVCSVGGYLLDHTNESILIPGDSFNSLIQSGISGSQNYTTPMAFTAFDIVSVTPLAVDDTLMLENRANTRMLLRAKRGSVMSGEFSIYYKRSPFNQANVEHAVYSQVRSVRNERIYDILPTISLAVGFDIDLVDVSDIEFDDANSRVTLTASDQSRMWLPGTQLILQ